MRAVEFWHRDLHRSFLAPPLAFCAREGLARLFFSCDPTRFSFFWLIQISETIVKKMRRSM
jgi:hypothetical protein